MTGQLRFRSLAEVRRGLRKSLKPGGHALSMITQGRMQDHFSELTDPRRGKVGIKNKRLTAGWDEGYLEKVLFGT